MDAILKYVIGPLIMALIGFLLDQRQKIRAKKTDANVDEKLDVKVKVLIERIESVEIISNRFESLLKNHLNEDDFKKDLWRGTCGIVEGFLIKNYTLGDNYKRVLSYYGDLVYKFGTNFVNSENRKNSETDRRRMIREERTEFFDKFNKFVDSKIVKIGVVQGKKDRFSQFLCKETRSFARFEALIVDLERNGLADEEIIKKFRELADIFSEDFIIATKLWENMNNALEKKTV